MVEITSLSDDEAIVEVKISDKVSPNQIALRENKSVSGGCCGSETSDHIYNVYNTSHYQRPVWKRRSIIIITIFGIVFGLAGLSTGLGIYFSRLKEKEPPVEPPRSNTTLTTMTPSSILTTSAPPTAIAPWKIIVPFIGVSAFALAWNLGFPKKSPPASTTTTSTTTTTAKTTTTTPTTTTTTTTTTTSIITCLNTLPEWSTWSGCDPAHNCLDTVLSGQKCPIRSRSGRVCINGELKDIKDETTEGCNCLPCTFRLTDWVGGDCTRDAGINGGDGDCPCHWTQYRYCQQLSNGLLILFFRKLKISYFRRICDENLQTWIGQFIIICM